MTQKLKNTKAPAGILTTARGTKGPDQPLVVKAKAIPARVRMSPRYKEKMTLPPEVEELSFNDRPMIWRDMAEFSARHSRTIADMVYDMVLLTNHAYSTKTPQRTVVPFDLEFLTRLYDLYPSSCAWNRPSIRDMFELMYSDLLKEFTPANEPAARLAMGRRYAKMLGRVDTAQYRWLTEDGKITRRLGNIMSKVEEAAKGGVNPREMFEGIGKRMWELRGFDIDKYFPLPTQTSVVKQPGTRGRLMRLPKANRLLPAPTYEGGAFL